MKTRKLPFEKDQLPRNSQTQHLCCRFSIFFILPVVTFGAIARLQFDPVYLILPVLLFFIAMAMAFLSYGLARIKWKDNTANLIGMALGGGNTGYFGFPIVLALFGPEISGIYLLMIFGVTLNEVTTCYYIGSRGHFSAKDSLVKVIKLPVFHASWLGILVSALSIELPPVFYSYWNYFTGAWIVIGMMLIGVALAGVERLRISPALIGFLFFVKFIIWPLIMIAIIQCDRLFFNLYDKNIHIMLLIIGLVPLIANTVAFASQLKLKPGEAAMAVLLSTIFALFYIPAVFWLLRISI